MSFSISLIFVIATCIFSYMAFQNNELKYKLMFMPYKAKHNNEYYRFLSHTLIHADFTHLLFNMFVLYSFGQSLEFFLGSHFPAGIAKVHFVIIYIAGGLFATVWPYSKHQDNRSYMSLGASGAVSAVVFACILWNPTMELRFIFIPIPIKAWLFGLLYLAFEYYMAKRGNSHIGHDAHFGGAIFGIVYTLLINFSKAKEFISAIFG